jgi:hypothetical protein
MAKLDDETRDKILLFSARLAAATALAVQPLLEREQSHPGQFGGGIHLPTPRTTATGLKVEAGALLALLPTDKDFPDPDFLAAFRREAK